MPEDFSGFSISPVTSPTDSREASNLPAGAPSGGKWLCKLPMTLDEVEREHILATLRFTKGNKLRAADFLGIGRYSLYRKARRLGINLDGLSATVEENQAPSLD